MPISCTEKLRFSSYLEISLPPKQPGYATISPSLGLIGTDIKNAFLLVYSN